MRIGLVRFQFLDAANLFQDKLDGGVINGELLALMRFWGSDEALGRRILGDVAHGLDAASWLRRSEQA